MFTLPKTADIRKRFLSGFSNHAGNGAEILKLPPPTDSLEKCVGYFK
jgi:hypothetical protein